MRPLQMWRRRRLSPTRARIQWQPTAAAAAGLRRDLMTVTLDLPTVERAVDHARARLDGTGISVTPLVDAMSVALVTLVVIPLRATDWRIETGVVPIDSAHPRGVVARAQGAARCLPSSRRSLCSTTRPSLQAISRS